MVALPLLKGLPSATLAVPDESRSPMHFGQSSSLHAANHRHLDVIWVDVSAAVAFGWNSHEAARHCIILSAPR